MRNSYWQIHKINKTQETKWVIQKAFLLPFWYSMLSKKKKEKQNEISQHFTLNLANEKKK